MSFFRKGAEAQQTSRFFLLMLPVMALAHVVGRGGLPEGSVTGLVVGTVLGAALATAIFFLIGMAWPRRSRPRP